MPQINFGLKFVERALPARFVGGTGVPPFESRASCAGHQEQKKGSLTRLP